MTKQQQHPGSPPEELVEQWYNEARNASVSTTQIEGLLAARAAQWGADRELEACREWGNSRFAHRWGDELYAARRPKPPSAIEQAQALIERHEDGWIPSPAQWHLIREGLAEGRKALAFIPGENTLEALPE